MQNNQTNQTKLDATTAAGSVMEGSGHWLTEKATGQVIPAIVAFLNEASAHCR